MTANLSTTGALLGVAFQGLGETDIRRLAQVISAHEECPEDGAITAPPQALADAAGVLDDVMRPRTAPSGEGGGDRSRRV